MIDFRDEQGTGTFRADDGTELFCRWRTTPSPRARVFILHGGAEHSGRYPHLWTFLHEQGYSVFAADHRGMGRSSGRHGDVERFDDYVEDQRSFVTLVERARGPERTILLGHSMGTIVAARYALAHPDGLSGLVLMSMPIRVLARPGRLLDWVGRRVERFAPTLRVPIQIRSEQLSSDTDLIRRTDEDPLVDRHATLRWGVEMLDAADLLPGVLERLTIPVLVLHGEADPIADARPISEVARLFSHPDSRVILFPGMRHELHNEVDETREIAFTSLLRWLDQRCPGDRREDAWEADTDCSG